MLIEASFGLFSASANGGVAFFAHVGGFIFGLLVARLLARAGQAAPVEQRRSAGPHRRNRRSQTPVAEMCIGAGSDIVNLVMTYQQ
jgi:hypothetical protein